MTNSPGPTASKKKGYRLDSLLHFHFFFVVFFLPKTQLSFLMSSRGIKKNLLYTLFFPVTFCHHHYDPLYLREFPICVCFSHTSSGGLY